MDHNIPADSKHRMYGHGQPWPYTRVVAALVLFPAVPMLLLSIATLALFYLAPGRFGSLIARLPGESFIRTALVFAPATLFAIVVLAVLYAVEKPRAEIETQPVKIQPRKRSLPVARTAGMLMLIAALPAFMFSLSVWALSFVSPSRFDRLLEPFPGETYLRAATPFLPWMFFALALIAVLLLLSIEGGKEDVERDKVEDAEARLVHGVQEPKRLIDYAVSVVLFAAIPALLGSLAALALYHVQPERFARVISRLPLESLVRAGLLFVPPTSFIVVVLAAIFLLRPRFTATIRSQGVVDDGVVEKSPLRSTLAMWVLSAGLSFSAALGLGLLTVIAYLLLR
ncbi:MAG: hypothetical protein E3J30_01965 [Anaerolineales bacterium]|nr:MAG: hypothetical protein E3J30_01965 [Anaerolineales bacterium]